jgi:hypothetical protein
MMLIWFIISVYIIINNNNTFLINLEYIIYANFFVSVSKFDFTYDINNLQIQYLISPKSYEKLNKTLISL